MASSGGNSSGSSGSEEELEPVVVTDQRKRKRMQSNRESAKRSRMRKQKHLDDLMAQVTQLSKDNSQILTSFNVTTQHYMNIETENSILRAQFMELSQRLESLNQILNFINSTTSYGINPHDDDHFMTNNNIMYLNQPIMASPDMFQYY